MLELLGIVAGLCFALSSMPLTFSVIKKRNADFIPTSTVLCIFSGSISMFIYLCVKNGIDFWVFFDYGITISCYSILLFYKILSKVGNDNTRRT